MPAENTPPSPAPSAPPTLKTGGSVLGAIALRLACPALGASAGFLLLANVWLPRVGMGRELQRIPEIAAFAAAAPADPDRRPLIVLVGDSIMAEGVDTRIVERGAPDWRVRNLGINANTPAELSVQLPTILRARPQAVGLEVRADDLGEPGTIQTDRAYAYAYAGYAARLAAPPDLSALDRRTIEALHSSRFAQIMRFRSVPIRTLNAAIRVRLSPHLRVTRDDDWTAPFNLTASISGGVLDDHIRRTIDGVHRRTSGGTDTGGRTIELLVKQIADAGATPVLIIPPQHPDLRDQIAVLTDHLREKAGELAARSGGMLIDASSLLTADQFADALHPNEAGRAELSRFIAEHLPAPPPTPPAAP